MFSCFFQFLYLYIIYSFAQNQIERFFIERNCKCSNCYIVGPTGPKGEADTIEVRNTITVDPSQDARVIDTYSTGKHILDFEISRGES